MFEHCGLTDDDGRTISSPCELEGSGELKLYHYSLYSGLGNKTFCSPIYVMYLKNLKNRLRL